MIAIVGTGNMAAAVGWNLAKLGIEFYFIDRSGPCKHSFIFNDDGQSFSIHAEVPDNLSRTELLFFCVKSYDLASSFDHLGMFFHPIVAVSLANGAVQQIVAKGQEVFSRHIFRPGFSTIAVSEENRNNFTLCSRKGEIQFGPLNPGDKETAFELKLTTPGSCFTWNEKIQLYQRRKWLFNTVINTLAAAKKLPRNGELLGDIPLLSGVFDEAFSLGKDRWGEWSFSRNDLYVAMIKLIEDTADNENSMVADLRFEKQTESFYLAGLALNEDCKKYPLLNSLHSLITKGS